MNAFKLVNAFSVLGQLSLTTSLGKVVRNRIFITSTEATEISFASYYHLPTYCGQMILNCLTLKA